MLYTVGSDILKEHTHAATAHVPLPLRDERGAGRHDHPRNTRRKPGRALKDVRAAYEEFHARHESPAIRFILDPALWQEFTDLRALRLGSYLFRPNYSPSIST